MREPVFFYVLIFTQQQRSNARPVRHMIVTPVPRKKTNALYTVKQTKRCALLMYTWLFPFTTLITVAILKQTLNTLGGGAMKNTTTMKENVLQESAGVTGALLV